MSQINKDISVTQASKLCGVGRTTVGYWIRAKKLRADRAGRNYSIPVEELLFFLESTGQKIPPEIAATNSKRPFFRRFQHCWEFWQGGTVAHACKNCLTFKNRLRVCFQAKNNPFLGCQESCNECSYFQDIYLPKIQFVHQIKMPAAVCKDMYFWIANSRLAKLCDTREDNFVGMGVEQVIHPSSLEELISETKKIALGTPEAQNRYRIFFKKKPHGKLGVRMTLYSLNDPTGAFLMLVEPEGTSPSMAY